MSLWLSICLAILGVFSFHLCQKSIPSTAHPVVVLVMTYGVATLLVSALLLVFPLKTGFFNELKQLNWACYALGISLVCIDVGYMLSYRAGWSVSLGAIVPHVAATVLLLTLEITIFHRQLSLTNLAGIFLSIMGLILVNR
jgi:hypothetical protein